MLNCGRHFCMPSLPLKWRRTHFVLGLSVRPSVRNHTLKVCWHDILETGCENFTKFTTSAELGR